MKKSYIFLAGFIVLIPSFASAQTLKGEGRHLKPYEIVECNDLPKIGEDKDAVYTLTENIECSESEKWNNGKGLEPVNFTGVLKGQGFEIRNLHIDRPNQDNVGLFSQIESAEITNIHLVNPEITGKNNVGAVAGDELSLLSLTEISGVRVSEAQVDGESSVGGLFGDVSHIQLSRSSFDGRVDGSSEVGGLIGVAAITGLGRQKITIEKSYSSGTIEGNTYVGGLVGRNHGGKVVASKFNGTVNGKQKVGGITGSSKQSTISRVISSGEVSGFTSVGGITGELVCGSEIKKSGVLAELEGAKRTGAVAGYSYPTSGMCSKNTVTETKMLEKHPSAVGESSRKIDVGSKTLDKESVKIYLDLDGIGPLSEEKDLGNNKKPNLNGSGTQENPYKISECDDIREINKDTGAHYVLNGDILCSQHKKLIERKRAMQEFSGNLYTSDRAYLHGLNKSPDYIKSVGSEGNGFSGTLDGRGYSINYLAIKGDRSSGIFTNLNGKLTNLELNNTLVYLKGGGGLISKDLTGSGKISDIGVYNSKVIDTSGSPEVAGLVTYNRGRIKNIYLDLAISRQIGNFQYRGPEAAIISQENRGKIKNIYLSHRKKSDTDSEKVENLAQQSNWIIKDGTPQLNESEFVRRIKRNKSAENEEDKKKGLLQELFDLLL
jgi:hypothetical protein